ncbi:MAG: hypothetical protein NTW43_06695 [Actinobacteria bacterium]|nr:hypothetical protein [Actinomycetota bacterium]
MDEKWEYFVLEIAAPFSTGTRVMQEKLTPLGLEGWEVCGFAKDKGLHQILLKRRLKE